MEVPAPASSLWVPLYPGMCGRVRIQRVSINKNVGTVVLAHIFGGVWQSGMFMDPRLWPDYPLLISDPHICRVAEDVVEHGDTVDIRPINPSRTECVHA